MSNFKKYMKLELRNGGLMYEHLNPKVDLKNPVIKKITETEGVSVTRIKRGHNISNPIPYTTLSNMLIALMGGIPVPTKPNKNSVFPSDIKRPEFCDEMAKNSYYKIDSPVDPDNVFVKQIVGEDGEYYGIVTNALNSCGGEFMQSNKLPINSNRGGETVFYVGEDGKEVKAKGTYNFAMLLRLFNDDENHPGYKRMISFISELLGVDDVRKVYTFGEMVHKLHSLSECSSIKEKVCKFYKEMTSLWDNGGNQSAWFYNMFRYGAETMTVNTDLIDHYGLSGAIPKTYLRNNVGDKVKRITVNGEIIVPIYDEKVYEALINGKGYCTFLDGGICEIAGIENRPVFKGSGNRYVNYEQEWTKIH